MLKELQRLLLLSLHQRLCSQLKHTTILIRSLKLCAGIIYKRVTTSFTEKVIKIILSEQSTDMTRDHLLI